MRLDAVAATAPHLIERLEHFRHFTMAHPRLVAARDELMDGIDGAAPESGTPKAPDPPPSVPGSLPAASFDGGYRTMTFSRRSRTVTSG